MSINSIFAGSTPNSRETIRQQYLNTLALDVANMTKNLNANKLFKANGSTGSAPPDTRSATEKYEDLDNLKLQVRVGLKQITDGMEAERIVADITTAELQFLAGQLPFIVSDLKPKWALGIPAGSFLPYLRKLMRKNIETEGVEYGLQSASGVGGGIETTANSLISRGEIEDLGEELTSGSGSGGSGGSGRRNEQAEAKMLRTLRLLDDLRPTAEDRQVIASLHDPDILEEYDEGVALVAQNLPSYNAIRDAFMAVPYQAKVARFDAIFDAVDWETMRGLKGAVARFRVQQQPQQQQQQPRQEEEFDDTLSPLGGVTLRNAPVGSLLPQQDEPDLPDSYVRQVPPEQERQYQLSAFAEEIPPEDFAEQGYNTKLELLRSYAEDGKFNDMDSAFLHMINAIMEGHEVPERDMDFGYAKFFRLKQLGGATDKGEMPQLPPSKVFQTEERVRPEQFPPTREPYQNEVKRALLGQMLDQGEFANAPRFEEIATEMVNFPEQIDPEMYDNFFEAFLQQGGTIPQASAFEEESFPFEEEATPIVPPKRLPPRQPAPSTDYSMIPPLPESEGEEAPAEKAVSIPKTLEEFVQRSSEDKKNILYQLKSEMSAPLRKRVDALKAGSQAKTLNSIFEDYIQYITPALLSSAVQAGAKPSSKSGSEEGEETTAEAQSSMVQPEGKKTIFPASVSAFNKFGTILEKLKIIEKAMALDLIDEIDEDSGDLIIPEKQGDSLKKQIDDAQAGRGKTPYKDTTRAVLEEWYRQFLPVIQYKRKTNKSYGMGLGLGLKGSGGGYGLPTPHHIIGKHGYGLPHTLKPQQPMGGSLHHTKSPLMGEWGSGLSHKPSAKKVRKNIIFGMGLSSVIPQPRAKVDVKNINMSMGIEAEPAYVPFGTHLLNKHRLKDSVVMMRTKKGGAIVNIPTQKVSSKLAKVLHTICGGGIPQFESVMDLADDDKALLHRITKTSKVSDRLSVPNPNKSKLEEEDNRFNILRGEIAIGQDNPQVIKEFKMLLLKFMREGRVPTGQGKAIMEELLLLGY